MSWKDPPTGTRSLVLLRDDQGTPGGIWHDWAAYDVPANTTSLVPDAAQCAKRSAFKRAINDFSGSGATWGVAIAEPLVRLAAEVDRRITQRESPAL